MSSVTIYNSATEFIGDGTIDLDTDTFKIMLLSSAHSIDKDDNFRNDIEAEEITGTGYTAGGATLASVTWTLTTGANGLTTFDAADVSWASSTITARYAAIYKSRGGASSADELVLIYDFGQDRSSAGTEFKIVFPATGIFRHKQS